VGTGQRKTVVSGGSTKVTVIFSKPPLKADDVIRELVDEMGPRMSDLTVVTSDIEVAQHARSKDATIVLSDLFAASVFKEKVEEQLNEAVARGKTAQRGSKKKAAKTGSPTREGSDAEAKPEGVSKKNAAEWMKLFGQQQHEKEENDW
jgi:hypothetical protein